MYLVYHMYLHENLEKKYIGKAQKNTLIVALLRQKIDKIPNKNCWTQKTRFTRSFL